MGTKRHRALISPKLCSLLAFFAVSILLPGPKPVAADAVGTVTVDSNFTEYVSATVGADGQPIISYLGLNGNLTVAHCGSPACTVDNTITIVDDIGPLIAGVDSSVTIGADGLPIISYAAQLTLPDYDLKVAHCGNAACTAGNIITTLDSAGNAGRGSSVTIGADGLPLISYNDETNGDLKVIHCGDVACTAGNSGRILDGSPSTIGNFSSAMVGADGLPVISYRGDNSDLSVIHCGVADCGTRTITTVDSTGVKYTSATLGADGLPVISYRGRGGVLKVAHCGNAACSAGNTITVVDSSSEFGVSFTSLAIGADGLPLIAYRDFNGALRLAHCGNAACSAGNTISTVAATISDRPSVMVAANGLPLISYSADGGLKLAICADALCTKPFVGVGGVAELPEVAGTSLETGGSSGPSAGALAGVAGAVAAGVAALGSVAWYARRRWRD